MDSFVMFFISGLICVWDLQSQLIMFVETITLEGIHANCGLQIVLKINETQQILSPCGSRFTDQPDLLESWVRTENVYTIKIILTVDLSLSGIIWNTIDVDTVFGVTGDMEESKRGLGLWLVWLDFGLIGWVWTHVFVWAWRVVHWFEINNMRMI